jgi:hypothetical protein
MTGLAGWSLFHTPAAKAATGRSIASLSGTYGYTVLGTLGSTTPLAALGTLVFDGNGGISGSETMQIYGQGTQTQVLQGCYTVNSDGSGTILINYPAPPAPAQDPDNPNYATPQALTARYSFVMVNGVTEILGMRSENGIIVTADFKAQ